MRENIVLDGECGDASLLSLIAQTGLKEKTESLKNGVDTILFKYFDENGDMIFTGSLITLVGNKTAIYISHRLSSCRFCDRIAVFSEGCIREYGTHEELVGKSGGIYAKMFAAQAQYYGL